MDVTHVEEVFANIVRILLEVDGKTKDHLNACKNLEKDAYK